MNNIKSLREKCGLTQEELGSLIGTSQGAVGHYEANRRTPSLVMCRNLVEVLNSHGCDCTLDDVFPPQKKTA